MLNRYDLLSTFNFQLFNYLFPCHPLHLNNLIPAVPANDYGNRPLRNTQPACKYLNQALIRPVIDRRRGDRDINESALQNGEPVVLCTGFQPDRKTRTVPRSQKALTLP
jgi:hypothetical protein